MKPAALRQSFGLLKGFAFLILTLAALDLAVAAVLFARPRYYLATAVVTVVVTLLSVRWFAKPPEPKVSGWSLGPATELTNPDRPVIVKQAVLASRFLNLGFLAIGSPGSGKTLAALSYIHSLRQTGTGWAFFEGKGDTDIYRKCVAMGSAPRHFFSSELPGSASVNLMAGDAHDVVDRLGKILIGETSSTSYYSDVQRAVLSRILPLLLNAGAAANLRDLYTVLTVEDAGRELLRRSREAGLDTVSLTLGSEWFNTPKGTRLPQISGLLNRLFVFVSGPYADRLNCYQPDLDIRQAVEQGESIYFHLPLTSFARDVAIALVETFGVEARRRQLSGTETLASYPLIFDDWGAFFHEGFGPFSARCRSAAMPLSFGFQSRAQLEAVSPTYADELDDTIATKIILRVHGAATARYAATLLGDYEAAEVSTSELGERAGTSLSHRHQPRIDARMLRELQPGEAFISTIREEGGRDVNPLWQLRIPVPGLAIEWESVPLPAPRLHAEGSGLALWSRYMDPKRLTEIHAQARQHASATAMTAADTRNRTERAQLQANLGFEELPT
jgi:hypothetical protein